MLKTLNILYSIGIVHKTFSVRNSAQNIGFLKPQNPTFSMRMKNALNNKHVIKDIEFFLYITNTVSKFKGGPTLSKK